MSNKMWSSWKQCLTEVLRLEMTPEMPTVHFASLGNHVRIFFPLHPYLSGVTVRNTNIKVMYVSLQVYCKCIATLISLRVRWNWKDIEMWSVIAQRYTWWSLSKCTLKNRKLAQKFRKYTFPTQDCDHPSRLAERLKYFWFFKTDSPSKRRKQVYQSIEWKQNFAQAENWLSVVSPENFCGHRLKINRL